MICTTCGVKKPKTREFFYFRKDTNNFRRNCIKCSNDRSFKTRPAGVKWYYKNTKELFVDNGLTPLFEKFEGRVKARKKLPALNEEGYKVWINIDKLKNSKIPNAFSTFNPWTIHNIKMFINKNRSGFKLLSKEYKNNSTKLDFVCSNGHPFSMTWGDFSQGRGCAKCSGKYQRTNKEFTEEIKALVGSEYKFLEEFKTVDHTMKVVHNKCGHLYGVTPYKFIRREQRCPKCNESKGERRVRKHLIKKSIEFEEEFSFDDCRYILPLRFDFAILNDGELEMLIEYDGRQHFESEDFYGGEEEFETTVIRDNIKNDYCKKNNIKLLRIPYTKYENINEILATHL